jgi:hypothetical protein
MGVKKLLAPSVKYDFHFTHFHKTHQKKSTGDPLRADLLYLFSVTRIAQ